MDSFQFENLRSDQWKSSTNSCKKTLERDDLRQVTLNDTWDCLRNELLNDQDKSAYQEFAMLLPSLVQLKTFTEYYFCKLIPKHDASIYWGLLGLILKLAKEEEGAIPRIPRMLREVFHKIEMLNKYFGDWQSSNFETKEACFETGITLLSLFSDMVKFMRNDLVYLAPGISRDNVWQPLTQQFSTTSYEIEGILSRMEKLSRFDERRRSSQMEESPRRPSTLSLLSDSRDSRESRESSKIIKPEDQSRFPIVIRPSTRTSRFFDRTDVVGKMNTYFEKDDHERQFRSLAIYGLGGVGKSSVAMKFAEGKLDRRELDCMFWIHSEKPVSIRQSFTEIAMRLKLPDARPKDHDENHSLVLNWLQQTDCRWLLIYDNAEDMNLLRDYWPSATRGQALITTRNRSFGFEIADSGLEIHTWDTETGSRFLLHLLSTDISEELKEDEVVSAIELSQKLSGHALAISHMAGLIHRRAWSIAEFMEIYDQHPSEMHGVSGNNSINALWDFSFRSLDMQSRAILGVLAFVEPDNIPQSLFELEDPTKLPPSLNFCSDDLRFSEAAENLLALALIKRDKASRTFSLHRLVQTSFKYFMTPEERNQSFSHAAVLVSYAFPRRDSNIAQLYLMWERCASFLPHVLSLKDHFREEKKANPLFTAPKTYCELNNACQRYLLEINSYAELEDLIKVNNVAISTIPQGGSTIGLQGSLTSHTGQLLIRLGRSSEGVDWLRQSYEIRSHDVPFNPRESAWAAENAANGISTLNDFKEGVKWLEISRDHWLSWSNEQDVARGDWPACIKKSLGVSLTWAGELDRARDLIAEALLLRPLAPSAAKPTFASSSAQLEKY